MNVVDEENVVGVNVDGKVVETVISFLEAGFAEILLRRA